MCLLLESICIKNKTACALEYHQERMDNSMRLIFGEFSEINLQEIIKTEFIPDDETYKCRIVYGKKIEEIQILPYQKRSINSIKIVECTQIDYSHKFLNRSAFEELKRQNLGFDELIISQNGFLTDTCFSNIALFDGELWLTPKRPLLKGVKREQLLDNNLIHEADIKIDDLKRFSKISLINAMLDLGELVFIVSEIR